MMTSKIFVQIDNQVIEAEGEQLAYVEAWKADLDELASEQLAAEQAKKESKDSAIQKLTALGLTEQEVFALLGLTPDEPTEPQE